MTAAGPAAPRWRAAGRLLALTAGLVAAGLLLRGVGLAPGGSSGIEWVDRHVRGQGLAGQVLFVAAGAAAAAVGMPRQGVAFLGGHAFGAAAGTALALAAQVLGCGLAVLWARVVGRAWAERRIARLFGGRLARLRDRLAANPFGATLALRLLPVGNNLALNLLGGLSGIAALPFLAASAVGYLPQTVVFALLGKGVRVDGGWQIGLATVLFGVSAGLGLWLLRRDGPGQGEPG